MFRLQESHSQQTELRLDDFGLALLHHQRTTAVGIGFPVYFLYLHASQLTVLAQKLKGIDVPAAGTALLVA